MFKSLSLGGLSPKELAKRVVKETTEDNILGYAAQLSYYFLLALFPALLFLTSLLGYFAGADSELRAGLFRYLSAVLPGDASKLVAKTVNDVTTGSGGGKLSFGILATLWAASSGMTAISDSLNAAYDLKETRPWWKVRLVAIGLTLALSFLIVSSLVLVLYGHNIADTVAVRFGLGDAFALTWKIVQWPIVLAFVLLGFALIYYFAPDASDQDWKWITPGSLVGVALWLLVSFAFKAYLHYFNSYNATYGTLGGVIILMLWFYFTGAAILVGGEMNSEVENAMAKRGAPDAKEKGEKAPGDKKPSGTRVNDDKQSSARGNDEPKRAKASAAMSRDRMRAHTIPSRVTRMDDHAERFSFGKFAVVLGAWALSKVGIRRAERKTH
jgi:membrane protein